MAMSNTENNDTKDEVTKVRKTFTSGFVLDKAKLTRMVSILEQRFIDEGLKFNPAFDIKLKNEKSIHLLTIDSLLSLDNAIKNTIEELNIEVTDKSGGDSLACKVTYNNDKDDNVILSIESSDTKLSNQLFAELEEQVDRTFVDTWVHRYVRFETLIMMPVLGVMSTVILLLIPSFLFGVPFSNEKGKLEQLASKAQGARTLEEKVDFIFEMQKREVIEKVDGMPPLFSSNLLNLNSLFIALPLAIVVGCIFYLFRYCYPRAVFLWGDYEEYYSRLKARRRTLWGAIMLSLVVGIIGNLFVLGVSKALRIG